MIISPLKIGELMGLNTIQDIERAIDALPPHELAELYWSFHNLGDI
jgi:hypothetical protein